MKKRVNVWRRFLTIYIHSWGFDLTQTNYINQWEQGRLQTDGVTGWFKQKMLEKNIPFLDLLKWPKYDDLKIRNVDGKKL